MFWVVSRRVGVIFGRFGVVWCGLGCFGVVFGVSTDPKKRVICENKTAKEPIR